MTDFIRNTAAPDGIHDRVEFNEYAPRGGWYASNGKRRRLHRRIKNAVRVSVFLIVYAAVSTAIFYI